MTIYYVAISLLIQSDNMQATNKHVGVRQLAQGMLKAPHIGDRTHNPVLWNQTTALSQAITPSSPFPFSIIMSRCLFLGTTMG